MHAPRVIGKFRDPAGPVTSRGQVAKCVVVSRKPRYRDTELISVCMALGQSKYYFVGSAGLLNEYLHILFCSLGVGVIWDFLLTESHLIPTAPGP